MKQSELTKQVVAAVQATAATVNDSDQRSALGMARTWVEKREPIKRQTYFVDFFRRRDDLAEELVRIMAEADKGECLDALDEARNWVNAPFRNPAMLARAKQRAAMGLVGSEKKNEKMAG